jgi:hypothetical protein
MTSETLTTTVTPADAAAASERGLMIAVLMLVLFGAGAMLLMS